MFSLAGQCIPLTHTREIIQRGLGKENKKLVQQKQMMTASDKEISQCFRDRNMENLPKSI